MTAFCEAKAKPPRLRGILTGRPHRGLPPRDTNEEEIAELYKSLL